MNPPVIARMWPSKARTAVLFASVLAATIGAEASVADVAYPTLATPTTDLIQTVPTLAAVQRQSAQKLLALAETMEGALPKDPETGKPMTSTNGWKWSTMGKATACCASTASYNGCSVTTTLCVAMTGSRIGVDVNIAKLNDMKQAIELLPMVSITFAAQCSGNVEIENEKEMLVYHAGVTKVILKAGYKFTFKGGIKGTVGFAVPATLKLHTKGAGATLSIDKAASASSITAQLIGSLTGNVEFTGEVYIGAEASVAEVVYLALGASASIAGPFTLKTSAQSSKLVKSGKECKSKDKLLGSGKTAATCQSACAGTAGCSAFILGTNSNAGKCFQEYTTGNCAEGFKANSYNYYAMEGGMKASGGAPAVTLSIKAEVGINFDLTLPSASFCSNDITFSPGIPTLNIEVELYSKVFSLPMPGAAAGVEKKKKTFTAADAKSGVNAIVKVGNTIGAGVTTVGNTINTGINSIGAGKSMRCRYFDRNPH